MNSNFDGGSQPSNITVKLNEVVKKYNNSIHSTTGYKPIVVLNLNSEEPKDIAIIN
jgi:hypothetical protein